jgi:hypothetical protein
MSNLPKIFSIWFLTMQMYTFSSCDLIWKCTRHHCFAKRFRCELRGRLVLWARQYPNFFGITKNQRLSTQNEVKIPYFSKKDSSSSLKKISTVSFADSRGSGWRRRRNFLSRWGMCKQKLRPFLSSRVKLDMTKSKPWEWQNTDTNVTAIFQKNHKLITSSVNTFSTIFSYLFWFLVKSMLRWMHEQKTHCHIQWYYRSLMSGDFFRIE